MKILCKIFGHKWAQAGGKRIKYNPYYIPEQVCVRCGAKL